MKAPIPWHPTYDDKRHVATDVERRIFTETAPLNRLDLMRTEN